MFSVFFKRAKSELCLELPVQRWLVIICGVAFCDRVNWDCKAEPVRVYFTAVYVGYLQVQLHQK